MESAGNRRPEPAPDDSCPAGELASIAVGTLPAVPLRSVPPSVRANQPHVPDTILQLYRSLPDRILRGWLIEFFLSFF
jgi:hypothetical protein